MDSSDLTEQSITAEMYYDLFQRSADAMLLIVDQQFVDINQAALKMLSYESKEELQAIHPSKLSPEFQPCGRHSFEKAEEMMHIALTQGSHCFEWVHRNSKGENFYVEVMLTSLGKGDDVVIHTVWRDISDRKNAEQNLRLAKTIVDNIREAVFITDTNGLIVFVNNAFTEVTGYCAEDAIGKNPSFMQSGMHDQSFYKDLWHQLRMHGQWTGDIWDRNAHGKVMLNHVQIDSVNDESGAASYYVAILTDITEQKINEKKLQQLAYFDSLTSLPNRRKLQSIIDDSINDKNGKFALLFIDLDRFKPVNDELGHDIGDKLLETVAQRMLNSIREVGTIGRVGGDEFALIIPAPQHTKAIFKIAQRLIEQISTPFQLADETVIIGASIGVSLFPEHSTDAEQLYQFADLAMYRAKQLGGNTVYIFDHSLSTNDKKID